MTSKKPYLPLLDIENVLPILNKISIFGGLDDIQLYNLFRALQKVEYHKGEIIFKKGDQPSHIYIIKSGKIELFLENEYYAVKKTVLNVGECFGESAVIGVQPHTLTSVAIEDSELIVLCRKALLSFYEEHKDLFGLLILNIARETSRRLNKADEVMLHYMLGD